MFRRRSTVAMLRNLVVLQLTAELLVKVAGILLLVFTCPGLGFFRRKATHTLVRHVSS